MAFTGGAVGSLFVSLRVGAARGVFTNEAGMGTAAMAHATADVKEPLEQGLMGIVEVFIDTIVICTATALVILCSGVEISYGKDLGIGLTTSAFTSIFGDWVGVFLSAALCLFAFATVLGWGLYGMQCARFLFGAGSYKTFSILQAAMVVIGSVVPTQVLWLMAETVNGLMAIPNLIVLWHMIPDVSSLVDSYEKRHLHKQVPGSYSAGRMA
jgi:AGCS family alanine or glycine:cation symporter